MKIKQNKCNGCAECVHCGRKYEERTVLVCDVCGDEAQELYETENGQECEDCIVEKECKNHKLDYEGECNDCGDYCDQLYDYVGMPLCKYCFTEALLDDLEKVDRD